MEWFSTCCSAPPLIDEHINEDDDPPVALCSKCKDWSDFENWEEEE